MKKKKKSKTQIVVTDKQAQKIIDNAMKAGWTLWIKTSAWGNRKKLSKSLLEQKFQDDANAISAIQRLIDSEEVRKVTRPMRKVVNIIKHKSLPWLHEGFYFIFEQDIKDIQELLIKAQLEMKIKRTEFKEKYPQLKAKAKKDFPKLYRESYYPEPDIIEEKFNLKWGWQQITLPMNNKSSVVTISNDLVKDENLKFQDLMKGLAEETITAIRSTFLEIITKMRDKLKDPTLKFKESTIEKPKQFLEDFKKLNLYEDQPFENMIDDLKEILDGVYAEDLRDDKKYRKEMGEVLDDVVTVFEKLPTVKLKRALDF